MIPDLGSLVEGIKGLWAANDFLKQQQFWEGIVVAVGTAIVWKIGRQMLDGARSAWGARNTFNLSGIWIGACSMPSYGNTESLEIWRYSRSRGRIKLTFYAYTSDTSEIHTWSGAGVFRGTKFSAYYYENNRNTYESGVLALEARNLALRGIYAQFDPKAQKESLYVSKRDYIQNRISLPFWRRLRMIVGLPPFATFGEVKRLYQAAQAAAPR
jgi:hypothetical protein